MASRDIIDAIPAEVRMISGCADSQTSADVSNVDDFRLPDPAGLSGGACTSALLQILYKDNIASDEGHSFQEVLLRMRDILSEDYTQIPQLTSSRPVDIKEPFVIVPNGSEVCRAVLIGINYVGQNGQLSGCHNDVHNVKSYLMDCHGFLAENITVLLDDGISISPTRQNILRAYEQLVAESKAGDVVFCHYSGHGGRLRDDDGDEADGYDETLVPLDYETSGQIRDDALFKVLVHPMAAGVTMTCLMDCCHSGTVLDLPYKFKADGESDEMELDDGFNLGAMIGLLDGPEQVAAAAGILYCCWSMFME